MQNGKYFDVVVVGFGIAGASFAIGLAEERPDLSILVISKSSFTTTNTAYAQGGIAVVHDQFKNTNDSIESHKRDTLLAGSLANDVFVVDQVVARGTHLLSKLEDWGVSFDRNEKGEYDISREGGHSYRRVFHHKDSTGLEIQNKLYRYASRFSNMKFREHFLVKDLIISQERCIGVLAFNAEEKEFSSVFSKIVVLATGGLGQVYRSTTNAAIATGDGIALSLKSGCALEGMHLVQFHPTALYEQESKKKSGTPMFLISEALRGEGAVLRNVHGQAFMKKYHKDRELAPRDKVARANFYEMQKTQHPCVYLDIRNINFSYFKKKFPKIYSESLNRGINIFETHIPVVPAAHYLCGGIKVDGGGQTSIPNLFSIGECASTGLHGANRLASNSLLEALYFADLAATKINKEVDNIDFKLPDPTMVYHHRYEPPAPEDIQNAKKLMKELKEVCEKYLGVVKSHRSIKLAGESLSRIESRFKNLGLDRKSDTLIFELSNLIYVSQSVQKSCSEQRENLGVYYNVDFDKEKLSTVS